TQDLTDAYRLGVAGVAAALDSDVRRGLDDAEAASRGGDTGLVQRAASRTRFVGRDTARSVRAAVSPAIPGTAYRPSPASLAYSALRSHAQRCHGTGPGAGQRAFGPERTCPAGPIVRHVRCSPGTHHAPSKAGNCRGDRSRHTPRGAGDG